MEMIKRTFEISNIFGLQSAAYDFLLAKENRSLITEISYAFGWDEGDSIGHCDYDLNWYVGEFNPFGIMIENLLKSVKVQDQKTYGQKDRRTEQ